jgi:hypothetical protein
VRLTDEEKRMLDGKYGKAVAMAMTILSKLGELYGAEELMPISQVHLDGCSFKAVGEAGLEFTEKMVDYGGKVCVPATTNPISRDMKRWREFRIPPAFAEKSRRLEDACMRLGAVPTWTCAPYLYGIVPRFGQQIAWAESNAINFVNSVIGARTARYGDFADICAAVTGRVPKFSLHLTENRRGEVLLKIKNPRLFDFNDDSTYPLIGYIVGDMAQGRIPVIEGMPESTTPDHLKGLSAAAASSGNVALFHILGITPEAFTYEAAFQGKQPLLIQEISEEEILKARQSLNTGEGGQVDLVIIGCPHASYSEVEKLVQIMNGKKVRKGVEFWVQTNRTVHRWLEQTGLLDALSASGVKVLEDTCVLNWALDNWQFRLLVTNSGKFAHYAPGIMGSRVVFGGIEKCVEAAVTGEVRRA